MKKFGKFILATASILTAAGALVTAGPATAASPVAPQFQVITAAKGATPPAALIGPHGEKPTEWGMASFKVDASPKSGIARIAPASVGGGTWNYGTTAEWNGKRCYSNYIHPDKKHSASVAFAGGTDKDVQDADVWAQAGITAGAAYTCNAYWGVY
ncbi:lactococcin 972 family bacteriocin [Streptomyces roseoverticillatus]|uniref:Lactococcin 972 family bacteriocin n=1 Tax=Streptomyces roseoverticillatus TaxID=66429 RepID=A0ABV3IVL9_9ACTN